MKPYGIISDTHNHAWSAFSTVNADGVNSRLQLILDETARCAEEVNRAGGNLMIHAGDLFHVRGSISPSVLNPTIDAYRKIIKGGVNIVIIAGNHDLEGKNANRISSAITALEGAGCMVVNSFEYGLGLFDDIVMVPWHEKVKDLRSRLESVGPIDRKNTDLIIHAPVDGVISGLPDHGLTADYLAGLGYGRVFSGHYHNHKDFGNGVYSVGAIAHHSWSDVGSKAGFLVVTGESVKWFKSHTPEFIDITHGMDPVDVALMVDHNYARVKMTTTKMVDVEAMREWLTEEGAVGVVIQNVKAPSIKREDGITASVSAGASIEESVSEYVKSQSFSNAERINIECHKVMAEAGV